MKIKAKDIQAGDVINGLTVTSVEHATFDRQLRVPFGDGPSSAFNNYESVIVDRASAIAHELTVEEKLEKAIAALERAEKDFNEIIKDDRGKFDPAWALQRVKLALEELRP